MASILRWWWRHRFPLGGRFARRRRVFWQTSDWSRVSGLLRHLPSSRTYTHNRTWKECSVQTQSDQSDLEAWVSLLLIFHWGELIIRVLCNSNHSRHKMKNKLSYNLWNAPVAIATVQVKLQKRFDWNSQVLSLSSGIADKSNLLVNMVCWVGLTSNTRAKHLSLKVILLTKLAISH